MRVFIADHSSDVVDYLKQIVEDLGDNAIGCTDSKTFTDKLLREVFDLVILDWNIRAPDDMSMLEWMNKTLVTRPPVIMMANRSAKRDITDALNAGADDYIAKPIKPRVLISRISAILRRKNREVVEAKLTVGDLIIDRETFLVYRGEQKIQLARKEFELLFLLAGKPGKVFTREYILEKVWGDEVLVVDRTIDVHIRRLRHRFPTIPIDTIKCVGYIWKD
jgi:two-component system alkaline phosphatase synthesis response regulator PhoP